MSLGSMFIQIVFHLIVVFAAPIFVIGLINRIKSRWSGRKGPSLNQVFFDLLKLFRKTPVYSEVSSWVFQLAPWVILATTVIAALICPIVPGFAPISFPFDFVYFAYLLGLGRFFMIIAAMDTGSSFEGMGASREATYSVFIEPVLFFIVGTLSIATGQSSFQELVQVGQLAWLVKFALFFALFVLLQIEAGRIPVDDPNTHLELTMIHEVMILDHSGPELAALQYSAAIKTTFLAGVISALINPVTVFENIYLSWLLSLVIIIGIVTMVGLIESVIARLRLRTIPVYALVGVFAGIFALVLSILNGASV